ncbi:TetR family transcriptional regulator [Flavobacterium sp. ANB]|uniref:TetR family transcriptional regulator C-terminal domain-containing protein n=1 Tax=unclassified Flavobacterium TaxID=196869 RepID=UPI0012B6B8FF|nr:MULTISPECIES: TetR family transcriptional regulator [unclassified Flavobacterium]MBF4516955.1 TetR family transcriptional regulator [Flavobacterium sp. ANB]MTD69149.1 TetR family transcriptional regulator [Flavobacterium sp. LC2016-13]
MNTSEIILNKVAPIFNKQGYVGTSLTDITNATGLTKGAIYCNFDNKEDLALKAFQLNINLAITPLFKLITTQQGSINKLHTITNYQRNYYDLVKDRGGCPMLRAGVDTKFINPLLFKAAQNLSQKFTVGLTNIINEGIVNNEIQQNTDPVKYAKIILSLIEGSSLLAFTHNDPTYIDNAMDFIDSTIIASIRK